jgi:4-hydroxybenzoate polyprenyltransferase
MAITNTNTTKESFMTKFCSTKRAKEVTFLSNVLSALLFIILPFIGFAIGFTVAGGSLGI